MKYFVLLLVSISLLSSCNKKNQVTDDQWIDQYFADKNESILNSTATSPLSTGEEYDFLFNYYWFLSDGRYITNPSAKIIDWVGPMTPKVIFYKLELPSDAVIYQERLRNEMFTLVYQTNEKEKLHIVKNKFYNNI